MGTIQLKIDKTCIDKELGYEIPDFIYEEASKCAKQKQSALILLGYEHVKEPYWLIKATAQYVLQIFDLERYKAVMEG